MWTSKFKFMFLLNHGGKGTIPFSQKVVFILD